PAARSTREADRSPGVVAQGTTGGTILLIEDEPAVRDVTCRLLGSHGCEVLTARDGNEAVACLRDRADVRAVLMDWNLPGLSGEDLIRQLRAVNDSVPVILMSGLNHYELSGRLESLGVAGYPQKPFRLTALIGMLRPWLNEPSVVAPSRTAARPG